MRDPFSEFKALYHEEDTPLPEYPEWKDSPIQGNEGLLEAIERSEFHPDEFTLQLTHSAREHLDSLHSTIMNPKSARERLQTGWEVKGAVDLLPEDALFAQDWRAWSATQLRVQEIREGIADDLWPGGQFTQSPEKLAAQRSKLQSAVRDYEKYAEEGITFHEMGPSDKAPAMGILLFNPRPPDRNTSEAELETYLEDQLAFQKERFPSRAGAERRGIDFAASEFDITRITIEGASLHQEGNSGTGVENLLIINGALEQRYAKFFSQADLTPEEAAIAYRKMISDADTISAVTFSENVSKSPRYEGLTPLGYKAIAPWNEIRRNFHQQYGDGISFIGKDRWDDHKELGERLKANITAVEGIKEEDPDSIYQTMMEVALENFESAREAARSHSFTQGVQTKVAEKIKLADFCVTEGLRYRHSRGIAF